MTINQAIEPARAPFESNGRPTASWAFFPGSGGGPTLWQPIANRFGGAVLPLPGLESVTAIADEVEPSVRRMPGPRFLVGNSLGAMVALELAQRLPVAGLMLVAAGWDFPVSEELIRRVELGGHSAFAASARRCVNPNAGPEQLSAVVADFMSREAGTMAQHLRAIRSHTPQIDPSVAQPATLVLRGGLDRSVSLHDHLELAARTGGALVPVASAAHMPFVDHDEEVTQWLKRLQALALAG